MLDAGPHHRVVGVVRTVTGDDGQTTAVTNMFTELATGMNRFDVGTGAWMPAQAIFEPTADGHVVARQTQHQVILAPDIGEVPAVDLLTPDGVRLQSSPVGIAWVDQASGASLMVARLRNAPLQLVSPSEALAQDCFAGLKADVRFRLTLDAFSADVILREQPVLPPGFTPETTVLEVLTEFLDPPQPVIQPVSPATGGAGDVQLGFGVMALGCGQAFALPAGADSPSISVQKSWQAQDGQACLIEATAWPALQPLVSNLPLAGQASIRGARPERLSRQAKAPDGRDQERAGHDAVLSQRPAGLLRAAGCLCPIRRAGPPFSDAAGGCARLHLASEPNQLHLQRGHHLSGFGDRQPEWQHDGRRRHGGQIHELDRVPADFRHRHGGVQHGAVPAGGVHRQRRQHDRRSDTDFDGHAQRLLRQPGHSDPQFRPESA
jgi:hypothetical protein